MSNRKSENKIQVSPEQREALGQYQKDFQKALPHITKLAQDAKSMHQAMIDAPLWSVIENPRPDGAQDKPLEPWSVGHAKVNYVDHIETTEIEGTQDK